MVFFTLVPKKKKADKNIKHVNIHLFVKYKNSYFGTCSRYFSYPMVFLPKSICFCLLAKIKGSVSRSNCNLKHTKFNLFNYPAYVVKNKTYFALLTES